MQRRNIIAGIALAATATLALAGCAGGAGGSGGGDSDADNEYGLVDAGTLTVCSDIPYPPFEFEGGDNGTGYTGFDIDLLDAIAKKLDLKLAVPAGGGAPPPAGRPRRARRRHPPRRPELRAHRA